MAKDYRRTDCQSKTQGLYCQCAYCVYIKTEGDKYFDSSVDGRYRDWRVAKIMELEDRIKALEAALVKLNISLPL